MRGLPLLGRLDDVDIWELLRLSARAMGVADVRAQVGFGHVGQHGQVHARLDVRHRAEAGQQRVVGGGEAGEVEAAVAGRAPRAGGWLGGWMVARGHGARAVRASRRVRARARSPVSSRSSAKMAG